MCLFLIKMRIHNKMWRFHLQLTLLGIKLELFAVLCAHLITLQMRQRFICNHVVIDQL